jgi:hypothetical protein
LVTLSIDLKTSSIVALLDHLQPVELKSRRHPGGLIVVDAERFVRTDDPGIFGRTRR